MTLGRILFSICVLCATSAQAQDAQQPKWGASIDFEGKLGTQRYLGEADAIVPLWQDNDTLVFGNARFRMDDSNSMEGNFGLAARHMLGTWNLGTYGYFDRRETSYSNGFNQLTFGAEALGVDFDVRANTYWPIGDTAKNVDALSTASISGTSVIFRGGEERAMAGFDGEVGWRVPVFDFESPYDLRVYGGGFHFYDPDDDAPDITGPRLRAELTSYEIPNLPKGTRVTLGTEWQNDDVRGSAAFGSLRLRMPLQSEEQRNHQLTAQERRMSSPIVRDIDIVAQAGAYGAPESVTATADGKSLAIVSAESGNGTLTDELAAAGQNSTVVLSGTFNTTTVTTLQTGQTLMGAGTVTVRSPSGRTAILTAPSATINGATASGTTEPTVDLADNSALLGLNISNTVAGGINGTYAVRAVNVSGITIANNSLTANESGGTGGGTAALILTTATNVTVTNNRLSATTSNTSSGASAFSISGSTVTASANILTTVHEGSGPSRALTVTSGTVYFGANTVSASHSNGGAQAAYLTGGTVTLTGNTLVASATGGGASGIEAPVSGGTANFIFTNNTISGTTTTGVGSAIWTRTNGGVANVTIGGNTLSGTGNSGPNSRTTWIEQNLTGTMNIDAASTGNVASNGVCLTNGTINGSVSFTNGTTCP